MHRGYAFIYASFIVYSLAATNYPTGLCMLPD